MFYRFWFPDKSEVSISAANRRLVVTEKVTLWTRELFPPITIHADNQNPAGTVRKLVRHWYGETERPEDDLVLGGLGQGFAVIASPVYTHGIILEQRQKFYLMPAGVDPNTMGGLNESTKRTSEAQRLPFPEGAEVI